MITFHEWLKNEGSWWPFKSAPKSQSDNHTGAASTSLKDAVQKGSEWHCPHCDKPLTDNELSKSVCSGCWNKLMPHPMTYYGMGKPEQKPRRPDSRNASLGPGEWISSDGKVMSSPINPGDANRIGGI